MKTTNELQLPKTNIQEVLYTLIAQGYVSIFDFPYMSGFRTRVSNLNLQYGLKINRVTDTRNNKFGNSYTYAIHKLPKEEKEKAIELYKKISKDIL